MASRTSRTNSIPIPMPPSNIRNIESVIPIPVTFSPTSPYNRNRIASSSSAVSASSPSLARSVPRSSSLSAGRSSVRQSFEPRIIRAPTSPQDLTSCPPLSSSNIHRRASITGYQSRSAQRQQPLNAHPEAPAPSATQEAFPRPAYLDHSAFRYALVTEAESSIPPRKPGGFSAGTGNAVSYTGASAMTPSTDSDDESTSTPSPRVNPASASTYLPSTQHHSFKLPTRWSSTDRHSFLTVTSEGLELIYNASSSNNDKDGASARADCPIPPACGIYYYEVEIRGKDQKSHVSIGFSGPNVKNSRLPGWEQNSWGYHGDDGCSFAAERNGTPYSSTYGTGDTIGCGIDFSTRRAFYTKNGQFLGNVFEHVGRGDIDLYPSVGLQHSQETIRVNFGQEPFKFDIDNHVQQRKTAVWNNILATPLYRTILHTNVTTSDSKLPALSEGDAKNVLDKLVLSYLIHHGYAKSVRAFQKQLQMGLKERSSAEDPDVEMEGTSPKKESFIADNLEDDIERRTRIVSAVISGDIDTALDDIQKYHPAVFEAEANLMVFKLRCRKFVELILATTEMKKEIKREREQLEKRLEVASTSVRQPPPLIVPTPSVSEGDWLEEDMGMDVDDDAAQTTLSPAPFTLTNGHQKSPSPSRAVDPVTDSSRESESAIRSTAQYEAALSTAIEYGQALSNDYKSDSRPEVRQLFKQTFGIVAWEDPFAAGADVVEFVRSEARVKLANELNQAILKSQGRPAQPALETVYRQASACITQLGLLGEGSAAFADMQRELLEV